ncbi:MAG: orotidine-5'-phosphate decarboxylase [Clostridia bacterium]
MDKINERIIVALDYSNFSDMENLVNRIGDIGVFYKVGLELYSSCGEKALNFLKEKNKKIFLDLKFHDIPNTVAKAVKNIAHYGVEITNLHASGGYEMMKAAQEALISEAKTTKLIAVTILTSLNDVSLKEIGYERNLLEQVTILAKLAERAGLAGVVCSPLEAAAIKVSTSQGFLTVTPGIRFEIDSKDDQKRTLHPLEALNGASDYIVIGRSITGAIDPVAVFEKIILAEKEF